jgi:hypothetical protein
MIHKKQFIQMAKKLAGSRSGVRNPRLMHPSREWWLGLITAVFIFTSISVWSAQTYAEYNNDALVKNIVEQVQPEIYRKSLVESVLEDFEGQAQEHSRLSLGVNTVLVPQDISPSSSVEEIASSTDLGVEDENIQPVINESTEVQQEDEEITPVSPEGSMSAPISSL